MAKPDTQKQIDAYVSEALRKVEDYKRAVESGDQVACRWIQLAVKRSRADEERTDIYFDVEAIRRVFEFFFFVRISDGERYKQFKLTPYQAWMLSEIFGWYHKGKDRKRRYRYAVLYTARKSGKTVFFVVVEFLILMYDYQEAPEAYLCATTREQAGQALKYSKEIIDQSPALRKRLKTQQFQILYPKRKGLMKVLANNPKKNDSLNPSIYIMDEMHAHETLDFFNVMKSGTLFRKNPLGIITSTAGFNKDYPFYTMLQTGKRVLEGAIENDTYFYALYTLDDDDDVEDFDMWVKANPNIGHTVRLDDLISEYKTACLTISERANFITKNLNRYLDNLEQWIPDEVYVRGFDDIQPPTGKRVQAFAGIDMSATQDLASLVIVWTDPGTGKMAVKPEFYFPQNEIKRVRDSGIDLSEWIQKGYIIEQPGQRLDDSLIFERLAYYNTIFDIQLLFMDKWNAWNIMNRAQMELYIDCRPFQQEAKWFNFPLKYLEKLAFEEQIAFSTNPVLRWMFRNVVLYYDGNGNIKIMKNKSLDSVDGPVALGMAVGAWLQFNGDVTASVFNEIINSSKAAG